eukprot:5447435-Pyramimonas_sp.AAC.1
MLLDRSTFLAAAFLSSANVLGCPSTCARQRQQRANDIWGTAAIVYEIARTLARGAQCRAPLPLGLN